MIELQKKYNTINNFLKNPYYGSFNNHNDKNNDNKHMKTLGIILELIGEQNDIEFEKIFDKYFKYIKFEKKHYKKNKSNPFINGDEFDTFNNLEDFLDKLENVKSDNIYNNITMYDELYNILVKIQEEIKLNKTTKQIKPKKRKYYRRY